VSIYDVEKVFPVAREVPHWKASVEVIRPYWTHRVRDRRQAKINIVGDTFYGGMSIAEAESMHAALGAAINLAKSLKLEKPNPEVPR
jgi:hypothetical protein